jgi:hypothetical protein
VLFGSVAKFVTDMGDTASDVFDLVSGRRCYACFHERHQNEPDGWLRRPESIPLQQQDATHAGSRVVFVGKLHTPRRESSSKRSKRKGWRRYIATLGNTATARVGRLAQGTLDLIIIPPMEISLTLSKGLRSTHSLINDDRLRNTPTVNGIRSGLLAARTVGVQPELESHPVGGVFSLQLINCVHRSSYLVFTMVLRG